MEGHIYHNLILKVWCVYIKLIKLLKNNFISTGPGKIDKNKKEMLLNCYYHILIKYLIKKDIDKSKINEINWPKFWTVVFLQSF